jgi:hypothetical protein
MTHIGIRRTIPIGSTGESPRVNILNANVAERLGDERRGPVGATLRRPGVEQRRNAPVRFLIVLGFDAVIAGLRKPARRSFA